ncbi:hypothetical protein M231_07013 [Tremella mesenterica]|uniref:Uncharacterized protein n=1 Tax=Tremella mesenterica TaxID=5217 RepID=A0A4Q1BD44_TREME|nr:hypothetical protein M231_07013 [Tremella mesenterica]
MTTWHSIDTVVPFGNMWPVMEFSISEMEDIVPASFSQAQFDQQTYSDTNGGIEEVDSNTQYVLSNYPDTNEGIINNHQFNDQQSIYGTPGLINEMWNGSYQPPYPLPPIYGISSDDCDAPLIEGKDLWTFDYPTDIPSGDCILPDHSSQCFSFAPQEEWSRFEESSPPPAPEDILPDSISSPASPSSTAISFRPPRKSVWTTKKPYWLGPIRPIHCVQCYQTGIVCRYTPRKRQHLAPNTRMKILVSESVLLTYPYSQDPPRHHDEEEFIYLSASTVIEKQEIREVEEWLPEGSSSLLNVFSILDSP